MSLVASNHARSVPVAEVPFEVENGEPSAGAATETENEENPPKTAPGMRGVRFASILMILFWICTVVIANANLDLGVKCSISSDVVLSADVLKECVSQSAVFRITAVVAIVLAIQMIACVFFVSAKSVSLWDDYWLLVKLPVVALACFGLLFPKKPLPFFDDEGFAWVARIAGFIFICFQSIVFLDWAYLFNEGCVHRAMTVAGAGGVAAALQKTTDVLTFTQAKTNVRLIFLLVFAAANLSVFFAVMGLLYKHFGAEQCKDSVTIITISLIAVIAATLCQLFNTAGHGSVTTSGILSLYVAYTTYTAVALNPEPQCNPTLGSAYGIGPMVLGLILSFLSVIYITFVAARKVATVMSTGSLPLMGLFGVVAGYSSSADYGTTGTKLDFEHTNTKVMTINLSFVFLLVTFYISMVLTSWGSQVGFESALGGATEVISKVASSVPASSVSMYMNACAGWVSISFYVIALCIPKWSDCLPTSIWNLRMK